MERDLSARGQFVVIHPSLLDQFTSARFNRRFANMTNQEPIQRERTCPPAYPLWSPSSRPK